MAPRSGVSFSPSSLLRLCLPGAAALGFLFGASGTGQAETMSLPGSFNVSANGAATYSVPISVPPGTAGMVPSLSLEYSSQGGSGLVGVGWALSGLPAIGRCPRTIEQDSVRGSVNYDANDRFCMEGQRLILTSGTYGAAGSEYRTEIEGFSKITASGTAGNGPASFTVKTKSGQIMEFGNTTDSRILAQGKTTARSWAVNKISDTKGNYLTVTYTNDTTNGQAYPTRIDYTGNASASLTPYNSVQFVYETRPDIVPMYHAGSMQKTTVRLTDIKTYEGANLVSDYKIAYEQKLMVQTPNIFLPNFPSGLDYGTDRSRVISIQLCDNGGTCLPKAGFASNNAGDGIGSPVLTALYPVDGYTPYMGDFDGDGRTDIFWCKPDSNGLCGSANGPTYVWLARDPATFSVVSGGSLPFARVGISIGDFNGDGRSDLLFCSTDTYGRCANVASYIWTSNGDGTFGVSTAPAPPNNSGKFAGDFNGDGRPDFFFCALDAYGRCTASATQVWLSTGGGAFSVVSGASAPASNLAPLVGNFDSDGFSDILFCNRDGAGRCSGSNYLWKGNGSGGFTSLSVPATPASNLIPLVGDINGDGLSDVFWCVSPGSGQCQRPTFYKWTAKGDDTFAVETLTSTSLGKDIYNGGYSGAQYYMSSVDFNNDGRMDVFFCTANTSGHCNGMLYLWPAPGISINGDAYLYATMTADASVFPGDYDGNGYTGILFCQKGTALGCLATGEIAVLKIQLGFATGCSPVCPPKSPPDYLSSFTTGLGLTTSVSYKPLTDSSVYTKDTVAVYPVVDVQGASYVVSGVAAANGIGGTYSSTYTYAGAKSDLNGRGFLGFREQKVTDSQTGIVQTTDYNQSFPKIGLVASQTKVLGAQTLNSTVNTYSTVSLGGTRYFVGLSQSVASSWDLDGTAVPAVTTDYTYDAYGNAATITVSTPDGASKVTTNTYTNDTTNWFLGRLTGTSVTSTVP